MRRLKMLVKWGWIFNLIVWPVGLACNYGPAFGLDGLGHQTVGDEFFPHSVEGWARDIEFVGCFLAPLGCGELDVWG